MTTPSEAIGQIRDSVCAIMRISRTVTPASKSQPEAIELSLAFVGTGWCINPDRYLVSAHHVLNAGEARDVADKFYAFTVPGNGDHAHAFPITGFELEDAVNDFAILEIGPSLDAGQHIPAVHVTMARPVDGEEVLTYGFPAPIITGAQVQPDGTFVGGGQFFLKGHANEGIVAAQYDDATGARTYEFNVAWHHGESGGPVFSLASASAFAVMQAYRNIDSALGTVAGPHFGRGLEAIQQALMDCGARLT